MTLFEIKLDSKFKIVNSSAFLDDKEFEDYYNLNNLSDNKEDDFRDYISNEFLYTSCLGTEKGNFGEIRSSYNSLIEHMKFGVKQQSKQPSTKTLYPEWLLFFIAIKKTHSLSNLEHKFLKHIDIFNYICSLRNKKHIISNIRNFLLIHDYVKADEYQEELNDIFLKTLDTSGFSTELLYEFLRFLYFNLHVKLKKQEKYKLMWNAEVYIVETIILLQNKSLSLEKIYKDIGGGTYSELHNIFKHHPLYIKESNKHFNNIFLPKIKSIFKNLNFEDTINYLTMYEKYENIIMSYLEIHRRFNADKKLENEIIMGAMIRNMILEVEEIIKGKKHLVDFLNSIAIDKEYFNKKRIKNSDCKTGQEYLKRVLDFIDEEETFDKYLLIYHGIRNYLAHHNIKMNDFFWNNDRKIASNTIDAVMLILYRIEVIKKVENAR